ncbi:DEAD/DEAH box helicase family protein [Patescibacteria group bacterium]|nr:DEAD/DEAH box helicase family protein [Patescibacteria group bacterium]
MYRRNPSEATQYRRSDEGHGKSIERPSDERLGKLREALDAFLIEPGTGGETRPIADVLDDVDPEKVQAFTAPTASGKTLGLAAELLLAENSENKPRRVIVVEPTQGTCGEAAEILRYLYGDDIIGHKYGGESQDRVKNPDANVLVTTTGTAWNMMIHGEIAPDDYVLFDEVHSSMGFGHTEAMIALLNRRDARGERKVGMGFATATMPENEGSGGFLAWAGAELEAVNRPRKYESELVPTYSSVTGTAENLLNDEAFGGRHFMVLQPSRREVLLTEEALRNFAASERHTIDESIEVVRYISGESPIAFSQHIARVLEENAEKEPGDRKRLVIVSTYGAIGTGVNMPVLDAVGAGTYIKPIYEDRKGQTKVVETPAEGSILVQAMGRVGRFADGKFFLCDTDPSKRIKMTPDEIPRPVGGASLAELVLDLSVMGEDPRLIEWYSNVDPTQVEKSTNFLIRNGLLEQGKLTRLAERLRRNPLARESVFNALIAENAPSEISSEVHAVLATSGEDWRSLFIDQLTSVQGRERYDADGRDTVRVTTLLENAGLNEVNIDGESVSLIVPESDAATMFNVIWYMRMNHIRPDDEGIDMAPRAFYGISGKVGRITRYLERSGTRPDFPITSEKWGDVMQYLIENDSGKNLMVYPFGGDTTVLSQGVVREGLVEGAIEAKGSSYGRAPNNGTWVTCLETHQASGRTRKGRTGSPITFTKLVLGRVPEEQIPWIEENRTKTLDPLYRILHPDNPNQDEMLQDHELVRALVAAMDETRSAIEYYRSRDRSVPQFDHRRWLTENLEPSLVGAKAATLEEAEQVLERLEEHGIVLTPDLESILPSSTRAKIEARSPENTTFELTVGETAVSVDLPIQYYHGLAHIQLPMEGIAHDGTNFQWESHYLTGTPPEAWEAQVNELPLRDGGYRFVFEGETYGKGIAEVQKSAVETLALQPLIEEKRAEWGFEEQPVNKDTDLDAVFSKVGMHLVGTSPEGKPLYIVVTPSVS